MNINPVGHPANAIQHNKQEQIHSNASRAINAKAQAITESTPGDRENMVAPLDDQLTVANGSSTEIPNTPGVVRLLEAGHFKGVADVRLRINFFDELSARSAERAAPVIQEHADKLIHTVTSQVDDLVGLFSLNEEDQAAVAELVAQFNAQVEDAVTSTSPDNGETLVARLGSAFDALASQLRELISTTDEPGSGDATPGGTSDITKLTTADGQPAPTQLTPVLDERNLLDSATLAGAQNAVSTDLSKLIQPGNVVDDEPLNPTAEQSDNTSASLDDALTTLRQAFEGALTSLTTAINDVTLLPEPTAPNGNGEAYAKFLSAYNELRGSASTIEVSA